MLKFTFADGDDKANSLMAKVMQQRRNRPPILRFLINHAPLGVLIQVNERPGLATQTEFVRQIRI